MADTSQTNTKKTKEELEKNLMKIPPSFETAMKHAVINNKF